MPFDPTQRERIRDDLREIVRGEVMFDDLSRGLYSTDASIFEVEPLRAVAPPDAAEVGVETMAPTAEAPSRLAEVVRGTAALLRQHDATIRAERPATQYNRCGFDLTGVLSDAGLNLPRLLVGSEGTLALFTEATLKTVPLPAGVAVVLLGFDSLDIALKASRLAEAEGPSACELLDRRLISVDRSPI